MTDLEHLTPHELLERVENRNRLFKIASVVFGAVTFFGLVFLVVLGLNTLQGVNNQLTQQKKLLDSQNQILSRIKASSDQRTKQINDLQEHIDCVVELLRRSNRQDLTITDLQNCKITNNTSDTSTKRNGTWTPSYQGSTTTQHQSQPATTTPQKNTTKNSGKSSSPAKSSPQPITGIASVDRLLHKLGL